MGASAPVTLNSVHWIVLFDGVCNLCNSAVQFIIHHDRKAQFKFASLQSAFGQEQMKKLGLNENELQTIILIHEAKFFDRSNAALEIVRHLDGLWPALYGLKIIPAFLRDVVYKLVAKYRYRVFGKNDVCILPTPELRSRFVE